MLEEITKEKVLLEIEKNDAEKTILALEADKKAVEDENQELWDEVKANEEGCPRGSFVPKYSGKLSSFL